MPLFDKVKAQAMQVAQKAQEAGRAGQARIEDAQARRRLDGLYRSLGAAVYSEHAGRGEPEDVASEIAQLLGELDQFEKEHGSAAMAAAAEDSPAPGGAPTAVPSAPAAAPPASAPPAPAGDFKLD